MEMLISMEHTGFPYSLRRINGPASAEESAMTETAPAEDVATGKKGAKSKADKKLARSADHHLEGKDAKVDRPMSPDRETVSRQSLVYIVTSCVESWHFACVSILIAGDVS